MKKMIGLIISLIMFISTIALAAERDITVTFNGERLSFDVSPQIVDGRTMVPIRAIFEAMGAEVRWDDATKTAICTKDSLIVRMTVGNTTEKINNTEVVMDIAPVVINNRTLAPARYVAEAFGYNVVWNGTLKTVIISSAEFTESKIFDDVMEQTTLIQQYINQKMYLEAMDLCKKIKAENVLSPADTMIVDELMNEGESNYYTYLTDGVFKEVNSYMNSKMYLEAIAACDEAIDKYYISSQDNVRLKEIKAEARAKYSMYHVQNKTTNPYNDKYIDVTGRTIGEVADEMGYDYNDFLDAMDLPLDMPEDTHESAAVYTRSFKTTAALYGMDVEEMKEVLGLGDEVTDETTWGEAYDMATIEKVVGEEDFEEFKKEYGFGDEVTLETTWGEVRQTVDTKEREKMLKEKGDSVN